VDLLRTIIAAPHQVETHLVTVHTLLHSIVEHLCLLHGIVQVIRNKLLTQLWLSDTPLIRLRANAHRILTRCRLLTVASMVLHIVDRLLLAPLLRKTGLQAPAIARGLLQCLDLLHPDNTIILATYTAVGHHHRMGPTDQMTHMACRRIPMSSNHTLRKRLFFEESFRGNIIPSWSVS